VAGRHAFTIGHSTHTLDALVRLLAAQGVRCVADVRRFPSSRRHPHFARDALEAGLHEHGIGYAHLEALGGRRSAAQDSPNAGLENAAFRGYADHMGSAEFASGLERLEALAAAEPTAVMCAEALWWRCHRRLVADALVARGWTVDHIAADGRLARHELTPIARVQDGRPLYPAPQMRLRG
jgi:uncharacterized protein (DUF488 family)